MRQIDISAVRTSLCQQTADFVRGAGFTDVLIGLSGGLDSSVVAALASEALGSGHVHGVRMPGPFSSASSLRDASDLAENLGMSMDTCPITDAFTAFERTWEGAFGAPFLGLAAENTQARLRMCVLMALSNERGWMVLNTGNLSEAAMGYSTLYGDTAGAFAPIGGLYKTEVRALAQLINGCAAAAGRTPPIPENVLVKPPSAELSAGQTDEDALGIPYADLDRLLSRMLDEGGRAKDLTPEEARIWRRYQANGFKRALEPPFAQVETVRQGESA